MGIRSWKYNFGSRTVIDSMRVNGNLTFFDPAEGCFFEKLTFSTGSLGGDKKKMLSPPSVSPWRMQCMRSVEF